MMFKLPPTGDLGKCTGYPKPFQSTAGSPSRPHSVQSAYAKPCLNASQKILFMLLRKQGLLHF